MQLKYYKRYCSDIENVENFEKAKADNFKGWQLHHRLETWTSDGERRPVDISAEELKALNMYYDRPANELIFLTLSEHSSLHQKGKLKTEEHKKKLSAAKKDKCSGENNNFYGKRHSDESKKKISEAKTGVKLGPFSEEHKQKLSEAMKAENNPNYGKHWYHNDEGNNILAKECPPGCEPGRLV